MKTKQIVAIGLVALLVFSLVYTGCKSDPPPPPKPTQPKHAEVIPPDFNEDSSYVYVQKQVDFGPRVPNNPPHTKCGDWLEAKLKSYGASVIAQRAPITSRDGKTIEIRNIIAQYQPEKKKRILLCAHWDTRPVADKDPNAAMRNKAIDGANDGASGVGVLLEIARQLQMKPTEIGVDIIFFDAEDNGTIEGVDETMDFDHPGFQTSWCLGSQYWAKNKLPQGYNAQFGILLDMVGAADAEFNKEAASMQFAGDVMNMVWNSAAKLGYSNYFINEEVNGVTDDHSFVNQAGIRCIDIIDTRPETAAMGLGGYKFGPYHHTHNDNMDIIDKNTLNAVGQTVLQVIYNLY